jgi:hypothetical protein
MAVAGGVNVPLFVVLGLVSQNPLVKAESQKLYIVKSGLVKSMMSEGVGKILFPFPVIHRHIGDAHSDGWPAVACLSPQRHQSVTATST